MRALLVLAAFALLSPIAWGDEPNLAQSEETLALGETTKDAACPCRYQAENKRLDGDLDVEESLDATGESDGGAHPGR